jgi:hypothetical protein
MGLGCNKCSKLAIGERLDALFVAVAPAAWSASKQPAAGILPVVPSI